MKVSLRAGIVGVFVCMLAASATAADGPWPSVSEPPSRVGGGERDAALVIGIAEYPMLQQPIPGADDNAREFYLWLTETHGVPTHNAVLLLNRQAVREEILARAKEMAGRVGRGGTLWLVFVGHGAPAADGKDGVLIGADAQQSPRLLYRRSVTQTELREALSGGKAGARVLVLDSCFSGKVSEVAQVAPGLQPTLLADRTTMAPTGFTVLTAGTSQEFAGPLPGLGRPAFTYLFLGALRGWADGDSNGQVTASEAATYARQTLRSLSGVTGRSQTPEILGAGDIMLAKRAREAGPKMSRLVAKLSGGKKTVAPQPVTPRLPDQGAMSPAEGVGQFDLGDLESLKQAQALADAVEAARRLSKDKAARPEDKAAAWDKVARVRVKGGNPFATEAKTAATRWREIAAARVRMRRDARKLDEFARLTVISKADRLQKLDAFLDAYRALSSESEYVRVRKLKTRLKRGEFDRRVVPKPEPAVVRSDPGVSTPWGYMAIQPGTFTMGSPTSEPGRYENEIQHEVTISRGFWLKTTEVTQGEYRALMGTNPSKYPACGDNCPVEQVTWFMAVKYCNALSRKEGLQQCYRINGKDVKFEGLKCRGYRLPTEAEWEYAARAGTTTALYTGPITLKGANNAPQLDLIGWYGGNSQVKYKAFSCSHWVETQYTATNCGPRPVALKQPNPWGLFDMSGGVWEWTNDWYSAYTKRKVTDPTGGVSSTARMNRGGSWYSYARLQRHAARYWNEPDYQSHYIGLRPARSFP